MKNFIISFCLVIFCLSMFALDAYADKSGKWFNPKLLRVYVPANHSRSDMMKRAFAEWTRKTDNNFVFRYITSPNPAQIVVRFVDVIPNADREIGLTRYTQTSSGKMTKATIYIADKTANGRSLRHNEVYTVMLHEIGHAMGITEHSKDPMSIMYPYENDVQEILKSDLSTINTIYGWE